MTFLVSCEVCGRVSPAPFCPEHARMRNVRKRTEDNRRRRAKRAKDRANGIKPSKNPYGAAHWRKTRDAYIRKNPVCCICGAPSKVPDHWPMSRRDLVAQGVKNPDLAKYLRPVCVSCHARETSVNQPGGWNNR